MGVKALTHVICRSQQSSPSGATMEGAQFPGTCLILGQVPLGGGGFPFGLG